jgi:hypothetical protein
MLAYLGEAESGARMTSQETDMPTPKAAISEAPEARNSSEAEIVDRAGNAILGLVRRRQTRLRQTSKRHGKSLRNSQMS